MHEFLKFSKKACSLCCRLIFAIFVTFAVGELEAKHEAP